MNNERTNMLIGGFMNNERTKTDRTDGGRATGVENNNGTDGSFLSCRLCFGMVRL